MKKKQPNNDIIVGISFVFGVFLLALSYNWLLLPNNFVIGGMSGIAIVLEDVFGLSSAVFIYASSFVLLIISFIFLGWKKTKNTIIGSLLYPLMITFTAPIAAYLLNNFPIDDTLLVIVFASILYGVSNGLIYKDGFTTGGSDVIMQLLNKYLKITETKAIAISNGLIIILGAFVFGYMKGIYSFIIMLLSNLAIDKVMFGISDSKLFYVFTRKPKAVTKVILQELESGYTILPTKGGYSHEKGNLILCVVPNRDYYLFKQIILEIDPTAFFVIENCYEVNGGVKRSNLPFIK